MFVNIFNEYEYEYDKFQNLDLRFVPGGGLGYHAIPRERSRPDLLGGASYNRSSFSTLLIRSSAELYWSGEYSFKVSAATSLVQSFRMFNDLTNTSSFRVNIDAGATAKLTKWLNWNA